jgi:hypothetical protein
MSASDTTQMSNQIPITIQVRMDDPSVLDTEGFESHDCCPDLMREFLKLCGISYEAPFACGTIAIDQPRRGPLANRPGLRKTKIEDSYGGNIFTLNEDAVSQVRIVCAGDFQNVVCAAVTEVVAGKKTLEEASDDTRERFRVISQGSAQAEVETALRWAVEHQEPWPYAEARLYQRVWGRHGSLQR